MLFNDGDNEIVPDLLSPLRLHAKQENLVLFPVTLHFACYHRRQLSSVVFCHQPIRLGWSVSFPCLLPVGKFSTRIIDSYVPLPVVLLYLREKWRNDYVKGDNIGRYLLSAALVSLYAH